MIFHTKTEDGNETFFDTDAGIFYVYKTPGKVITYSIHDMDAINSVKYHDEDADAFRDALTAKADHWLTTIREMARVELERVEKHGDCTDFPTRILTVLNEAA